MCPRFARAGSPRRRGGIFNAAFGMVVPLAGGRCVPRTGVSPDCPLGVAWPASSPCLSPLPTLVRPAPRCRGGADCPNGEIGNSPSMVKIPREKESWPLLYLGFWKYYVHELIYVTPPYDVHMVCISKLEVREGQGHKFGETCRPSHKSKGSLFICRYSKRRNWGAG